MTTDTIEIQTNTRKHCKQLHANKLDNREEVDNFLEAYNLPRLHQEETKKSKHTENTNKTESVIERILTNKIPEQIASQVNFTKHSKKN